MSGPHYTQVMQYWVLFRHLEQKLSLQQLDNRARKKYWDTPYLSCLRLTLKWLSFSLQYSRKDLVSRQYTLKVQLNSLHELSAFNYPIFCSLTFVLLNFFFASLLLFLLASLQERKKGLSYSLAYTFVSHYKSVHRLGMDAHLVISWRKIIA